MALYHTANGSPVEVKNVVRNNFAVNYVQKDSKLVFASQDLYLTGPNNYTMVGNPTITDGVATDLLNRTNSIRIPAFPDVVSSFEMVLKSKGSGQNRVILFNSYTGPSVFYKAKTQISRTEAAVSKWVFKPCSNSTEEAEYSVSANGGIPYTPNEWVYVKHSMVSNGDDTYTYTLSYSLDGTTYTDVASKTSSYRISGTDWGGLFICSDQNYSAGDSITINGLDLKESYIKIDGSLWFYGKNYATQNIAPVPSGYTYGTTTTSAIGYVDMRTQAFTAAPTGATIGRDE